MKGWLVSLRCGRPPCPQRPIIGKPNEFGYVTQLWERTEDTRRAKRSLILLAATAASDNPGASLRQTVAELARVRAAFGR